MPGRDEPRLVVFDLDGVVTSRDTMAAVVRDRLFSQPWRLVIGLPAVLFLLLSDRWPTVRRHPARSLVRITLLGRSVAEARRQLADAGARFGATPGWGPCRRPYRYASPSPGR